MEKRIGPIGKMLTRTGEGAKGAEDAQADRLVRYSLPIGDGAIALNPLLGRPIRFRFTGRIFCIHCGKATKTSFSQGYCYRCMQTLAQCDMCILKPEICHHHLGTCREPEWGLAHCMIDHVVYLANSSGIKVGITRAQQVDTRWMDQGAVQALPIARVKNRRDSGLVEIFLGKVLPDKTNWRVMLQGEGEVLDLKAKRDEVFATWGSDLPGEKVFEEERRFTYPVRAYPAKPVSLNLDKQPLVEGELLGIKGQYLLLGTGVINMRKYGGYELVWESDTAPSAEAGIGSESEPVHAGAEPDAHPSPLPPPARPTLDAAAQTSQTTLL